MLEMDVLGTDDIKRQAAHTLQSTIEGHKLYLDLCEKLTALKQLVSLGPVLTGLDYHAWKKRGIWKSHSRESLLLREIFAILRENLSFRWIFWSFSVNIFLRNL